MKFHYREQHAFCELGTAQPLRSERVQDVSLVLFRLEQCVTQLQQQQEQFNNSANRPSQQQQPQGADGSGRAGFGRAGEMNFRR